MSKTELQDLILQRFSIKLHPVSAVTVDFIDDYKIEIISRLTFPVKVIVQIPKFSLDNIINHIEHYDFNEVDDRFVNNIVASAIFEYKKAIVKQFLKENTCER